MPLPRGFGVDYTPKTEPPKKCILGKVCDDSYRSKRCKTHQWTWNHDEAWLAIRIIISIVLACAFVLIVVWLDHVNTEPARNIIEGYSCDQLAEYIADRSKEFDYAEWRYEWLCVNEQIKEFQG